MTDFWELDRNGNVLEHDANATPNIMKVLRGTSDSEIYNRYCPSGTLKMPGRPPIATVRADSRHAAYVIGRRLLLAGSSPSKR